MELTLKQTTVRFNDEFEIVKVWYNNKRVRLTPWREDRIWNAFDREFDLNYEMHIQSYPEESCAYEN